MTPAQTLAKFAEMQRLAMSSCTMSYSDRYDHYRLVAMQRARDEAKGAGSPQMKMEGM